MTDIARLIASAEGGDPVGAVDLLPLVYAELRTLAAVRLAAEGPGHTLQPTALVHEAYLRLLGPDGEALPWDNRGHFFAAAAEAMRRILVDSARRKRARKRGGGVARSAVDPAELAAPSSNLDPLDLLALDKALGTLAERDPRAAELLKLRYFAGLTVAQAAKALGIPQRSAERDWAYARAWLRMTLGNDESERDH